MGDISSLPDEIIHNILVWLPLNLLVKLKYVCKRWNRLLSDPYYGPRGERKVLLPFAPINYFDVLEENDTTSSMVPFSSSTFANSKNKDKDVTFAGSCNGIVLLIINQDEHTRMVLYNPLTGEKKLVRDDCHSQCKISRQHVYGFGYGSTLDELNIVRFRACEYFSRSNDNWHTCDVFSSKTNSWIVLKKFVRHANRLNDVGIFLNGSLHWLAYKKIVSLDVKNMVLSVTDIHLPFPRGSSYKSCFLGTLHGSLCILAKKITPRGSQFTLWVMTPAEGVENNSSWLEASTFTLNLNPTVPFPLYTPVSILDDGMVLILIVSNQRLVIYDAMKHSYKVIAISASPSYFQRIHGIEYVESLVSPSSLFNNIA